MNLKEFSMKKHLPLLLIIVVIASSSSMAQEENAREVFKRSRKPATEQEPKGINKDEPSVAKKTGQPSKNAAASTPTTVRKRPLSTSNSGSVAKNKEPNKNIGQVITVSGNGNGTLGLGYTLFLDQGAGNLSSVSSTRVFQTGQGVRLLLESNIDGYLYIFHQENDGAPKMLFPSWQDDGGNNYIRAHRLVFVPSENKITFTGTPAVETLTVVVSREPISGLPIREELKGKDRINVPLTLFHQLTQPCSCREDRDDTEGLRRKDVQGTRDVELTKSDPLPAYILLNRDQNANLLTTRIELVHR
jgi:hypothetical protein